MASLRRKVQKTKNGQFLITVPKALAISDDLGGSFIDIERVSQKSIEEGEIDLENAIYIIKKVRP